MNPEPTDGQKLGIPELDGLEARAAAEKTKLDGLIEANAAASARRKTEMEEAVAATEKAKRQLSAAKGRLTRARNTGTGIEAAEENLRNVRAAADMVFEQSIQRGWAILDAGHEALNGQLDQMRVSWDAGDAVINAIEASRPT